MGILEKIDGYFSTGDPEVLTWFLVRETYLPFLACALYVIFCTIIGPNVMRDRKPFDLRIPMIIFNFSVVIVYAISLVFIAINLAKLSWEKFCVGASVQKNTPEHTLAIGAYVIYVIKYVEFLDTVFFVLRKKNNQISKLHVIHHTLVPIVGWVLLRTEKSGFPAVPILINAIVHVIMYSYYGLSAMGPSVQKYLWWKKYVTQIQMLQFIFMIVFVTIITPLSGCSMTANSYIVDMIIGPLFLYLFYEYYHNSFKSSTRSKAKKQNTGARTSIAKSSNFESHASDVSPEQDNVFKGEFVNKLNECQAM